MTLRSGAARICLLAVLAGLSLPLVQRPSLIVSEDRNCDGRADVWRYYDGRGQLHSVLRDRNFDGYVDARERFRGDRLVSRAVDQNFDRRFEPGITDSVAESSALTFNLESQPFLLPRHAVVDSYPIADRAPAGRDSPIASGASRRTSDRAPPSASL